MDVLLNLLTVPESFTVTAVIIRKMTVRVMF